MGSRIREKPEHIFEVFAEVGRPTDPDGVAFVLQSYPDNIQDKKLLESEIPKFAFPGETDGGVVDHFSFVLTDEEGKFKYGFCRHAAGCQTCLCVISFLPWFEIFYRLLNQLAEILNRTESNDVRPLLEALYRHRVPSPGDSVGVLAQNSKQAFTFTCPNIAELPRIPQSRNLTEYYNAVDVNTMMSVYASMLHERRILIISRKLSRLTACVHGSTSLLYPMFWQHIYIPVLPPHLIDYCTAPMPFLIGIHSTLYKKLRLSELGDVVIVDADQGTISSDYNDLEELPSEVVTLLKKRLKAQNAEKIGMSVLGDGVAKAFLRANVALIGGYRQALRFPPGEQITFDEDAFVHSRPPSMQPFLQTILRTQMFEQFINDRLDKLIAGEGFSDVFDEEVNLEHDKWATQSRYKEWYSNMKKQGKKMKDRSRKAVKDIRTKFDELRKDDAHKAGISRNRPATINSPDLKAQRPPRPPLPDHSSILGYVPVSGSLQRKSSVERTRQYKVITMDELDDSALRPHTRPRSPVSPPARTVSPGQTLYRQSRSSRKLPNEDTDILSDMTYQRVSMDLLGDQDIQKMLKKSYSLEDLTLSGDKWNEESTEESDTGSEQDVVTYRALEPCDNNSDKEDKTSDTNKAGTSNALVTIDEAGPEEKDLNSNSKVATDVMSDAPVAKVSADTPERIRRTSDCSVSEQTVVGFEDDFNVTVTIAAPPMPPRVPLKRGHTIDTSTVSTSNTGLHSDIAVLSTPQSGHPVARPRTSIARQPAFYRQQRPTSFRKSSASLQQATDAQTIKEARTAFMKSETTKSMMQKRDELEQFDPLITGQLAVDSPRKDPDKQVNEEENLLKEWNLDFKSTLTNPYQAPPLPPKPVSLQSYAAYSSSPPSLNTARGYWSENRPPYPPPVYPQVVPPLPRQPSVQQLIRHYTAGGGAEMPGVATGRPLSQVMMRSKIDLSRNAQRPASVYLDTSQDPFSDLLAISTAAPSPSSSRTTVRSALPPDMYTNGDRTPAGTTVSLSALGQDLALKTTVQPGPVIEHPQAAISVNTAGKKLQSWETFD